MKSLLGNNMTIANTNSIGHLSKKIDKIFSSINDKGMDSLESLDEEEKEVIKEFAQTLVAWRRIRRKLIYVLIFIAILRSQWDTVQDTLIGVLTGDR